MDSNLFAFDRQLRNALSEVWCRPRPWTGRGTVWLARLESRSGLAVAVMHEAYIVEYAHNLPAPLPLRVRLNKRREFAMPTPKAVQRGIGYSVDQVEAAKSPGLELTVARNADEVAAAAKWIAALTGTPDEQESLLPAGLHFDAPLSRRDVNGGNIWTVRAACELRQHPAYTEVLRRWGIAQRQHGEQPLSESQC